MAYNTIMIKGEGPNIEELEVSAAVTPGMILELYTTKVRAHSVASGTVKPVIVALELELEGKGITDAYASGSPGDFARVWHPKPGDQFYGLLADGENVSIGDKLASAGGGYLKKHDTDSLREDEICAVAREAVDRSSSSGGDTNTTGRIVVESV